MTDQNNAAHDLGTSSGGRAYIADYFATHLRRHDFAKYINSTLAADFACALAQHLSKLRAEGVQAGDEDTPPIAPDDEAVADAWITASDCDGIAYDGPSFERGHRAALASAPVAGEAQPAIILKALDEYGPQLEWTKHWVEYPVGTKFYAAPQARPSDDALWDQTLTERDEYHDMADKLANAIADHLLVEIGEHSSSNCPWIRALEAIENAGPQASEAVRNAALEEAARMMEQTGKRIAAADIRSLKTSAALSPTQPTEQGERDE